METSSYQINQPEFIHPPKKLHMTLESTQSYTKLKEFQRNSCIVDFFFVIVGSKLPQPPTTELQLNSLHRNRGRREEKVLRISFGINTNSLLTSEV